MLTKQERNATAERLNKCEGLGDLYYAVIGEELPTVTSYEQDVDAIFTRLSDLCDTSNMIELPLDKDGQVIHIGDTVYVGDKEFTVNGFMFNDNGATVRAVNTKLSTLNFFKPDELTHKKPGTIASLVSEIRHVIDRGEMTSWSMSKLFDISDQLEKLGDSDD